MSMNVGSSNASGEPEVMMDINTTPLIDVMLVLLIMLIITIPIQLHAINIDLPTGNPPPQLVQPQIVKIDIDEKNQIFFNAEPVTTMDDVNYRLSEMAKLDFASQPELHLRPNKLVSYKVVAMVMASAQRLGVTKIGLVGNEQFMN